MLIWGWRSWARTIAHGIFFCPHCGVDRSYAHKRAKRWFTLFFIPVIPLKVLGEYVQCETCSKTFNLTVLDALTSGQVQETLFIAVRKAVTVLARQADSPAAETAAIAVLSSFADRAWSSDELAADMQHLDTSDLAADLANLAAVMSEQGKEHLLAACVSVASTGGVIDADGRSVLDQVASGLLMTSAHARGVVDQALEQPSS